MVTQFCKKIYDNTLIYKDAIIVGTLLRALLDYVGYVTKALHGLHYILNVSNLC
jgi:hypothetical protein